MVEVHSGSVSGPLQIPLFTHGFLKTCNLTVTKSYTWPSVATICQQTQLCIPQVSQSWRWHSVRGHLDTLGQKSSPVWLHLKSYGVEALELTSNSSLFKVVTNVGQVHCPWQVTSWYHVSENEPMAAATAKGYGKPNDWGKEFINVLKTCNLVTYRSVNVIGVLVYDTPVVRYCSTTLTKWCKATSVQ